MNDKKVSKNRQKKETIVAQLSEKVAKAKAIVFTNYQGMTHVQLEQLKKGLKATDAELVVAKNTLLKLALKVNNESRIKNNGKTEPHDSPFPSTLSSEPKGIIHDSSFEGPTATLFAYDDVVLPLKALAKVIKTLKLPTIKFGIVDGQLLAENDVVRLSTLPSREVLLAQFVGGLKSPIYGLHRALNWNLQKFVMTLSAIAKTKAS